ncbi:hypothetical protein DFH28DRAFT_1082827 [Melampsora americana]|nr:hypothetical protein DFH28DRAFT_1082827 [Melampsora americana]
MSNPRITILLLMFWLCDLYFCMEMVRDNGFELYLDRTSQLGNTEQHSLKSSSGSDWFQNRKIHHDGFGKFSSKRQRIENLYPGMQDSTPDTNSNNEESQSLQNFGYHGHDDTVQGWSHMNSLNSGSYNTERGQYAFSNTETRQNLVPGKKNEKGFISSVIPDSTTGPNFDTLDIFGNIENRQSSTQKVPEKNTLKLFGFDLNTLEEENEVAHTWDEPNRPDNFKKFQLEDSISESSLSHHKEVDISFKDKNLSAQKSQLLHDIFSPQPTSTLNDGKVHIGVDMQKLKDHDPIVMCSSAAVHFTQEFLSAIRNKYKFGRAPGSDMIKVGENIWTFETLLPHVYFLSTLNPSLAMWKRLKEITASVCRAYHLWYLKSEDNKEVDLEQLSRFLLWHTDVLYQACRNHAIRKLVEKGGNETFRDLMLKRMSTLPQMLQLVHGTVNGFDILRYRTKTCFLQNYFSISWKSDLIRGYPDATLVSNRDKSILDIWKTKSKDIMEAGRTVFWPNNLLYDSEEKSILLVDEDVERDIENEKNVAVRDFLIKWKFQFEEMISSTMKQTFTHNLPVSDLECYCLGFDHLTSIYSKRSHFSTGLSSSVEYNVKLFANFLSHDFSIPHPGTGIHPKFWGKFSKKLSFDHGRSIRRNAKRTY